MRIGFSCIYSWRPHVEHTYYLASLVQQAGHEVRFLTCDADLPTCYTRELRDRSSWRECAQCRMGGVRSYSGKNISSIGECLGTNQAVIETPKEWAYSSASTLGRFESHQDYLSSDFTALVDKIKPVVCLSYQAARNWILREKLDAICVFNGRIDATRAIFEAAKSLNVPVVSHERTWFGDGIQLFPGEHCLGLSSVWKMVVQWKDKPLTRQQAFKAASPVAKRFLKQNQTEWRAYNVGAIEEDWPVKLARHKFLILPSSTNETWGHPDWTSGWNEPLDAFDAIIEKLSLKPDDLVMRCHPNWAEKIGKRDGALPQAYYSEWARKRGIQCIMSHERASTMHLIRQCDAIIVAASSAALEGGMLGKLVVSTSPSIYHLAGFTCNVHQASQLDNLDSWSLNDFQVNENMKKAAARQALRFAYTMAWRLPQYGSFIKAISTTRYKYLEGADPQRFIELIERQEMEPDDPNFANGDEGEDEVLLHVEKCNWSAIISESTSGETGVERHIKRRGLYQMVEKIRSWSEVGDR